MKTLYLRIWLTVVGVLLLFALVTGWIASRNIEREVAAMQGRATERATVWAELIENSLPGADAPPEQQRAALLEWSQRLRWPLALDDAQGHRIATSETFANARDNDPMRRATRVPLSDGRALWLGRPGNWRVRAARAGGAGGEGAPQRLIMSQGGLLGMAPGSGAGLAVTLAVLFLAVALGAYPVVRRLTRRLESLRAGVEKFGAGQLSHRLHEDGRDEVAAVAASFNQAAQRIEDLIRANKSLLANASHELRSPLARMKMAVSMLDDASPAHREKLKQEINTNIRELDALVEEVLLASRLDAVPAVEATGRVDLLALAAEETARVDAAVEGVAVSVNGDEKLLRRALRNLLENAHRYGGGEVSCTVTRASGSGSVAAEVQVRDRGPGVPEAMRDRIYEPFFRLPGHAEHAGGVGLGLSLVKQIAQRHGGSVRCEPREGGGSCFVLSLPAAA